MFEARPWGGFYVLASGPGWQVKKLVINAHSSISLQYHEYRTEFWKCVVES